jgi:hypothetical protein
LNRVRCEDVEKELAFVADRLNDPLVVQVAQAIADHLTSRIHNPVWQETVTFEGE